MIGLEPDEWDKKKEVIVTDPRTGGQKGQKPERFDLIPWDALEELARVYGFGTTKYEANNWLRGYKWSLSVGALVRHFAKWVLGQSIDPETGCHHLAHVIWHCCTLFVFERRGLGTDDRRLPTLRMPLRGDLDEDERPRSGAV